MPRIKNIPAIYDECENQDLRCLVALPDDSRTYILDDYDEGWTGRPSRRHTIPTLFWSIETPSL